MDVQLLTSSGTRSMQVALNCWYSEYDDMAVLNAGIGCEHLLKAYLANHHPLLISDDRDQALRFYAIGRQDAASVPLSHAKTISAERAFRHVEALIKSSTMRVTWKEFENLLIERNSVAHAAYCDKSSIERVLTSAVAIADVIRDEFGISEKDFWGKYAEQRVNLVAFRNTLSNARKRQNDIIKRNKDARSRTAIKRKVSPAPVPGSLEINEIGSRGPVTATKIVYARKIYEARWGSTRPYSIKSDHISRKGDIFDFEGWEQLLPGLACSAEPIKCPACGYPEGWTYGQVAGQQCKCETPGRGDCVHYGGLEIWAQLRIYHCEACSLESHDIDELIELGFNVEKEEIITTVAPIRFEGREKR